MLAPRTSTTNTTSKSTAIFLARTERTSDDNTEAGTVLQNVFGDASVDGTALQNALDCRRRAWIWTVPFFARVYCGELFEVFSKLSAFLSVRSLIKYTDVEGVVAGQRITAFGTDNRIVAGK